MLSISWIPQKGIVMQKALPMGAISLNWFIWDRGMEK